MHIIIKIYINDFHLFSVEITVRGPIDRRTGMVLNITELKEAIETVIMKRLDHKNLDKDVEYFADTVNYLQTDTITVNSHYKCKLIIPDR